MRRRPARPSPVDAAGLSVDDSGRTGRSAPSPFLDFGYLVVGVNDPAAAAQDWHNVFGTPIVHTDGQPNLPIGSSWMRLRPALEGQTGVRGVGVLVGNVPAVAEQALKYGATRVWGSDFATGLLISGVTIELLQDRGLVDTLSLVHHDNSATFTRIHHVVVAVEDQSQSIALWRRAFPHLPAPEGPDGYLVPHHVPVGDAWFGITDHGTDAALVQKWLRRRGEGVYAVALVVPDREGAARSVVRAGGRIVRSRDGRQVFVHPATTHGLLVELAEEWPGDVRRP